MANRRQWDEFGKNYTLYQYSDDKSAQEICNALVEMGYNTLSIDIVKNYIEAHDGQGLTWMPIQGIERYPISQNRRGINSPANSRVFAASQASSQPWQPAAGPANRPNGETTQAAPSQTNNPANHTAPPANPTASPDNMPWGPLAARFTIFAHQTGRSVPQILAQLRRNGYDVTAADVAASLNQQGVYTVRISDYVEEQSI